MPAEPDPIRVRELTVEPHGATVLILQSTGDEAERRLFRSIPVAAGDGLVLASAPAIRSGTFRQALRHACRLALTAAARRRPSTSDQPRLFLAMSGAGAVDGRGRALAQKVSREFAAQIYAPDGPVTFVLGGSIFAGADHHGWVRFTGGRRCELHGARYPRPDWENQLPRGVVTDGGLHTRPVPAGLAVSGSASSAEDVVSHAVAVSAEHPRLVLGSPGGEPIAPHRVAALLRRFPRALLERMQLVPADPATITADWLGSLAEIVGQELTSSAGLIRHGGQAGGRPEFVFVSDDRGNPRWQPFAALLRHLPDRRSLPLLAAAPPDGWIASAPLQYRWARSPGPQPGPHEVVAKVVPAGLAMLPAAQAATAVSADRLAFEPARLTIALGSPCTPLPAEMPVRLHHLLNGLTPEQRACARLLVLGVAGRQARAELFAAAGAMAGQLVFPTVLSADSDGTADSGAESIAYRAAMSGADVACAEPSTEAFPRPGAVSAGKAGPCGEIEEREGSRSGCAGEPTVALRLVVDATDKAVAAHSTEAAAADDSAATSVVSSAASGESAETHPAGGRTAVNEPTVRNLTVAAGSPAVRAKSAPSAPESGASWKTVKIERAALAAPAGDGAAGTGGVAAAAAGAHAPETGRPGTGPPKAGRPETEHPEPEHPEPERPEAGRRRRGPTEPRRAEPRPEPGRTGTGKPESLPKRQPGASDWSKQRELREARRRKANSAGHADTPSSGDAPATD
ncbi:hypothetical protein [Saccharopolyspora sp. SCSIO 74807]|uniref:hypothetical protein n=1 Tax=Saccharopolyspora sp. SCSIO 74807 TaxID=3118084 RepID=UPI0030D1E4AC